MDQLKPLTKSDGYCDRALHPCKEFPEFCHLAFSGEDVLNAKNLLKERILSEDESVLVLIDEVFDIG